MQPVNLSTMATAATTTPTTRRSRYGLRIIAPALVPTRRARCHGAIEKADHQGGHVNGFRQRDRCRAGQAILGQVHHHVERLVRVILGNPVDPCLELLNTAI